MTNTSIVQQISNPPNWSTVSDESGVASIDYQRLFSSLHSNSNSLINRAQEYILRNPDFNLLSANGYNPVTQASPNLTEIVSKWFVSNGAGNTFSLTPTAYTATQRSASGSVNYLNVVVTTLASTLSLLNQNYSTTGQFRADSLSGQLISLSAIIRNNNLSQLKAPLCSFSANTPGFGVTPGEGIFLQTGLNFLTTNIQMPDFGDTNLGANPYTQFQFNIDNAYSENLDFDIFYLKSEVSDLSTPLIVNHILETITCNALT